MNIIENVKRNKKFVVVFLVVLLCGIFFRTYQFRSWMRFSVDQARDAGIVSAALENKEALPLLGPKAGTTTFKLGSIYYYFSYFSAKLFGNYPDKMAYPSLLSATLAIPLMFFLMRKYFQKNLALAIIAVMSFFYLLVISSRFSSNPNVVPFFLLLFFYALLEILNKQQQKNYLWSSLAGLALGVLIQLHTTLLVIMPLMLLCVFGFLLKKKAIGVWRSFALVLILALTVNASQLIYEVNHNFGNSKVFLASLQSKNESKKSLAEKVYLISACQLQANSYLVSSAIPAVEIKNNSDNATCEHILKQPKGGLIKNFSYYLNILVSSLFFVSGYGLLFWKFKQAETLKRKNFLGLFILFQTLSFIVFIPVAEMMHTGYFNILFPIPLILLGLLFEFSLERFPRKGWFVIMAVLFLLLCSSSMKLYALAGRYARGEENNSRNVTLGEVERMSKYVLASATGNSRVYFSGQKDLVDRYYKTINYFAEESGLDMTLLGSSLKIDPKNPLQPGVPIFYIQKNEHEKADSGEIRQGCEIISNKIFSSQTILILKN
jgi:4-amino-4-deoxy-L-arabinose transferase-like glycosyltransferase